MKSSFCVNKCHVELASELVSEASLALKFEHI